MARNRLKRGYSLATNAKCLKWAWGRTPINSFLKLLPNFKCSASLRVSYICFQKSRPYLHIRISANGRLHNSNPLYENSSLLSDKMDRFRHYRCHSLNLGISWSWILLQLSWRERNTFNAPLVGNLSKSPDYAGTMISLNQLPWRRGGGGRGQAVSRVCVGGGGEVLPYISNIATRILYFLTPLVAWVWNR